jgi:hypothetical protein
MHPCRCGTSRPSNPALPRTRSSRRRYGLRQFVSAGWRFNFLRAARTLPSTVSVHGPPAVFMSGETVPPWHLARRELIGSTLLYVRYCPDSDEVLHRSEVTRWAHYLTHAPQQTASRISIR